MARDLARWSRPSGGRVRVLVSEVADGDLSVPEGPADYREYGRSRRREALREALRAGPWTWLRQVHGDRVVEVHGPGDAAGSEADAAVTTQADCVLSIQVADCAPVALASAEGLAVAHVGWRGLRAGVLERASEALAGVSPGPQRAVVGPCIRACCYEFGAEDLDGLVRRYGEALRATTAEGLPALDLAAGVLAALRERGVEDVAFDGACTGCDPRHWSHRASGTSARQALVAWIEPA